MSTASDQSGLFVPQSFDPMRGEIWSLNRTYEQQKRDSQDVSPAEFRRLFPPPGTPELPELIDPTQARYWDLAECSPEERLIRIKWQEQLIAAGKNPIDYRGQYRRDYFHLTDDERAMLDCQGFVVSDRLATRSFVEQFDRVFRNDLPVFMSADALLHAWSFSFENVLEDIEEAYLRPWLIDLLTGALAQIPQAYDDYGSGLLAESLRDADCFLSVALTLLNARIGAIQDFDRLSPSQITGALFSQAARIDDILQQIDHQDVATLSLFGRVQSINSKRFQARGRYDNSSLRHRPYFQSVTWLSVNTLVISGVLESSAQLCGALVLYDLVQRSGLMDQWVAFDRTLRSLIGTTESLGLTDLGQILADVGIDAVCQLRDQQDLLPVEAALAASPFGRPSHKASAEQNPHLGAGIQTFSFLPQRFMVDSWALNQVLGRDWNGDVWRYPSCLDVAFAVFGNDAIAPDLADRAAIDLGEITATRGAIDSLSAGTYWQQSIVTQWLAMLRELSVPADDRHPAAMRTTAWARRLGETQLASWTQLRHATILYAQPQDFFAVCEYPAALVELRPEFWRRFAEMVCGVKTCIRHMFPLPVSLESDRSPAPESGYPDAANEDFIDNLPPHLQLVSQNLFRVLDRFIVALQQLGDIAELQLAQSPLTPEQTQFLRDVIESEQQYGGMRYTGWYPQLFYMGFYAQLQHDSKLADGKEPVALVTDVCAFPNYGQRPAWALHQAIGQVDLLTIVADTGQGLTRFAGPVFSHYEFATEGDRWTDERWQSLLHQGDLPARPSYTNTYRVSATGQRSSSAVPVLKSPRA